MVNITLERLLRRHRDDIALLIGNGINRYQNASTINSWDHLLKGIARACSTGITDVPMGTALTEFYDVLELRSTAPTGDLQAQFCQMMENWRPFPHHRRIMGWADRHSVPVLTTNFDEVLSEAASCEFQWPGNRKFTSYYPWECRFAHELLHDPCARFGIWHINGMARYKLSIRLGLTHYMGSVQRARTWLHSSGDDRLFSAKNRHNWTGANTWMHLVFNKPLLIFGLALEENEVFLRWLLIERARYFRKFEDRRHPAWYVYVDDPRDERQGGKLFFLKEIGIQPVRADSFEDIYANAAWCR